jgi:periplasmic protein CpxP/Spy
MVVAHCAHTVPIMQEWSCTFFAGVDMTHTRRFIAPLALALGLTLAAPLASHAEPGFQRQGHHQGFGKHRGDFTRGLNLTDAQRDKIFELRHAAEPALRAKSKEVRAARRDVRQVAMTEKFDESRALAVSNQAARVQAEYSVMRLRLSNQIYNVLTPEQRKQAAERKQRFGRKQA